MIQLIPMYFEDKPVPFLEWGGSRYTTGTILAETLGVTPNALYVARHKNADMFHRSLTLSVGQGNELQDFLEQNKGMFSLKRMRKDTILYELRESLRLAFYVRSKKASAFSEAVIEFYAQHMRTGYVTREEHESVAQQLQEMKEQIGPLLKAFASNAGKDLAAAKATKPFRSN